MVKPIENHRMLDLLRVCRAELFLEHQLITEEEYSWLATLPSKETHARLADYDVLRKQNASLREALNKAVNLTCNCARDPEFRILGHAEFCDARATLTAASSAYVQWCSMCQRGDPTCEHAKPVAPNAL